MSRDYEDSWATLSRQIVYQGRVTLADHTVRLSDGTEAQYEVDESVPFAVATLVIDHGEVLLARQYRYPLQRWILDLPGGAGSPGEDPIDAARRELEEELGVVAEDLRPLHTFYVNPGRAAWPVHLFVSTDGIHPGRSDESDPAEQVRAVRVQVHELDRLIRDGEVVDPGLLIARAVAAAAGVLPPLGVVVAP